MTNEAFDVVVVGAGPGGYVAAIRAARHGLKTAVVEKDALGGECLNHGCIPSKALIHAAENYAHLAALESIGIAVTGATVDLSRVMDWKDRVVKRLTGGVQKLLAANGVKVVRGEARFAESATLRVTTPEGEHWLKTGYTIVATGARSVSIPSLPFDGEVVISHREALSLREIPPRLLVVGGGYIGVELGMVYAQLGSEVTVVELTDGLLPGTSREAVKVVERNVRRLKIKVLLQTKAAGLSVDQGVATVTVENDAGKRRELSAEKVLVTVGRRPVTEGLDLAHTDVVCDARGFIEVDAQRHTTDRRIYAIGDVAGEPLLAHKASAEALVAVDAIAGKETVFETRAIPAVVFTRPEIATVGLSSTAEEADGRPVAKASFPYLALGRALTMNSSDGYFTWVYREDDRVILGCEIVGREASNLIGEAALAVTQRLSLEDVARTIHPHPTLGEGLAEAAEWGLGWPIHLPPPR